MDAEKPVAQRIGKTCSRLVKKKPNSNQRSGHPRILQRIENQQVIPLLHTNETFRILDTAISWFCKFFTACAESDPTWTSATNVHALFNVSYSKIYINMALDRMQAGDLITGGRLL